MDAPFRSHGERLDRGDILDNVPFHKWKDGELRPNPGRGIVTSDGCDCEDYERALKNRGSDAAAKVLIHVAPLRPASVFPDHRRQEIWSGNHLRYFGVSGDDEVLADQVVDLHNEQPFPAALLVDLRNVTTIADWQWRRLLVHFAVSRFHEKPENLFLPELFQGGDH